MPVYVSSQENIHTYAYSREDMGRAIALTLEYAQKNPDAIAKIRAFKDKGEAIAVTFDDATDCAEPWDLDDIDHALVRTI